MGVQRKACPGCGVRFFQKRGAPPMRWCGKICRDRSAWRAWDSRRRAAKTQTSTEQPQGPTAATP